MAEPRNSPPQDERTDLQKEIDRQQIYDEFAKAWAAQQKAMTNFENNSRFDGAVGSDAAKIPYVSEPQRAYELMRRLFEMRQQQQQLEKGDQGGQGSLMRPPNLEWNSRYGNKAPLPMQTALASSFRSPQPSTLSDAPHWLARSVPPMSWASQPPSPPPVSDTPSWLDPGPVGKALRRVLGFPE